MSAHTPGPWATNGTDWQYEILDSRGRKIGSISKHGPNPGPDARVAVAAPELLEALERISKELAWAGGKLPRQHQGVQDAIDSADAIIAKARGDA